jgi:hypothetical protein
MTTKQVKAAATTTTTEGSAPVSASISTIPTTNKTETNAPAAPNSSGPASTNSGPSNLFISVKTFDAEGKTVGERIVDMYHFGTRNWLQNHHWWAMHNGHCVETNVATPTEIENYLAASKTALAQKFNKAA